MCLKNQLNVVPTGPILCITVFLAMFLVSYASAIDMSMSCDAGSTSLAFNIGSEDSVKVNAVLSQDALQNIIFGSGNFKESHSVKNKAGYEAIIGVNLTDAESYVYSYSYSLEPDEINITA
jgi:hypothetical protein